MQLGELLLNNSLNLFQSSSMKQPTQQQSQQQSQQQQQQQQQQQEQPMEGASKPNGPPARARYRCTFKGCHELSEDIAYLTSHYLSVHLVIGEVPFVCLRCKDYRTYRESFFSAHMKKEHRIRRWTPKDYAGTGDNLNPNKMAELVKVLEEPALKGHIVNVDPKYPKEASRHKSTGGTKRTGDRLQDPDPKKPRGDQKEPKKRTPVATVSKPPSEPAGTDQDRPIEIDVSPAPKEVQPRTSTPVPIPEPQDANDSLASLEPSTYPVNIPNDDDEEGNPASPPAPKQPEDQVEPHDEPPAPEQPEDPVPEQEGNDLELSPFQEPPSPTRCGRPRRSVFRMVGALPEQMDKIQSSVKEVREQIKEDGPVVQAMVEVNRKKLLAVENTIIDVKGLLKRQLEVMEKHTAIAERQAAAMEKQNIVMAKHTAAMEKLASEVKKQANQTGLFREWEYHLADARKKAEESVNSKFWQQWRQQTSAPPSK